MSEEQAPYESKNNNPHKAPVDNRFKCYSRNHFPEIIPGEWFTESVLAMDANGLTYIVFYNFDMSCWLYADNNIYTQTSVEDEIDFNWCYIPPYLKPAGFKTICADCHLYINCNSSSKDKENCSLFGDV